MPDTINISGSPADDPDRGIPDTSVLTEIPDHVLLRQIGKGGYGEVWLAQSVLGTYRAIKIVRRGNFQDDSPYDREFRGMKSFEPVSRSHDGLINILHVGRNDKAGYFYYIMELADDSAGDDFQNGTFRIRPQDGESPSSKPSACFDAARYEACNLKVILTRCRGIALNDCIELGLALSAALQHLHDHQLIHRDIKPSNIIFVNGKAKIADIGLVAELGESQSFVGTEGFIAPEGPGSGQADLYSLGKVLYEAGTGFDRRSFPIVPDHWSEPSNDAKWFELNEIILKACEKDPRRRYLSAEDMHSDLQLLRAGKSVRRLRALERRLAQMNRLLLAVGTLLFLAASAYYLVARAGRLTKQRLAEAYVTHGTRSVNDNDLLGSLAWYGQALLLDEGDPERERRHRIHMGFVLLQSPRLIRNWFQDSEAEDAEFSPDGARFAVVGSGGTIHAWNMEEDSPVLSLAAHDKEVNSISHSSNGAYLASGSFDETAKIWAADTGDPLQVLAVNSGVFCVQFHPLDDGLLLTASGDGVARLWAWRSTRLVMEFANVHSKAVRSARFNHDGSRVVTASHDETAQVWNVADGMPVGERLVHDNSRLENWVYDAAFSPDGQLVATATFSGTVSLWDANTGRLLWTWLHEAAVGSLAFSPDGRYLATAAWDLSTRVWSVHHLAHKPAWPPLKHNGQVHSVSFDSSGRRLLTANAQGIISLWDLAPVNWKPQEVSDVYSDDGKRYVDIDEGGLRMFDVKSSQPVMASVLAPSNSLSRILLSRDASRWILMTQVLLFSGRTQFWAQLWDPLENPPKALGPLVLCHETEDPEQPFGTVCSQDAALFAYVHESTVEIWNMMTGDRTRSITMRSHIASPVFDPKAQYLAFRLIKREDTLAEPEDTLAVILETAGSNDPILLAHDHSVRHVQFSPRDPWLVTSCLDDTLLPRQAQRWEIVGGSKIGSPYEHADGIWSTSFSVDGRRLISASEDETAQIWDVRTGKRLTPPMKHKFQVYGAAFSVDGQLAVTASRDKTARVWNAETGEAVTPPMKHPEEIWKAQFLEGDEDILTTGLSLVGSHYRQWRWELKADPRPVDDLLSMAQLLSCNTIDFTAGALTLSKSSFEKFWRDLRSKYAASFTVTTREIENWHRQEYEKCLIDEDTRSAAFHLDLLRAVDPGIAHTLEEQRRARGAED